MEKEQQISGFQSWETYCTDEKIFGEHTTDLLYLLEVATPETYNHSLRVAHLLDELATHLQYSDEDRIVLVRSGLLHDFGKFSMHNIVENGKKLTSTERGRINEHPRIAYNMFKSEFPREAQIIVAHHEFQNDPYPRSNPRGVDDENSLLLAISDVTDALLSKRSYKSPWTPENARKHLKKEFEGFFVSSDIIDLTVNTWCEQNPSNCL